MREPSAFQACFSDFKLIKSRKVAQFLLEVPLEGADSALAALGGLPRPDAEIWVGVARLTEKPSHESPMPSKEHRKFRELPFPQQAALRCNDPAFRKFIKVNNAEEAAIWVREHCGVTSRSQIDPCAASGSRWHDLNLEFEAWKAVG